LIKYSKYSTRSELMVLPNIRRLFAAITAITIIFMFSSCMGADADSEASDKPLPSPGLEEYHNGAYGISVTVPEGWVIASINRTNMTESPEKSSDPNTLDITPYEDSGSGLQLIELWSRENSADREHASLMIYIEIYDGLDEHTYLQAFEDAYAGYFDGYHSTLTSKDDTYIGGTSYTLLQYLTQLPDSEDEYYEEYYIRKIDEGKFLVLCVTYWAGNQVSQEDAAASLEFVTTEK
jgi:hypothetical protein